jgi:hypothetical protein
MTNSPVCDSETREGSFNTGHRPVRSIFGEMYEDFPSEDLFQGSPIANSGGTKLATIVKFWVCVGSSTYPSRIHQFADSVGSIGENGMFH